MMIKSSTSIQNNYEEFVRLSKERREPIFLTRDGEGEMVLLPLELWEQREAELDLLFESLRREQNRLAGAKTYSMEEMEQLAEEVLREG